MDGAHLFIKYAFAPNNLKYCGPNKTGLIYSYLENDRIDPDLIELLSKFDGANIYLKYISETTGLPVFSYKVVEAYWIGNELLNKVSIDGFYKYIRNQFKGQWDNQSLNSLFSYNISAKPHHGFHVMGMLARKNANDKLINHISNCLIMPARITSVSGDIIAKLQLIKIQGQKISLGNELRSLENPFGYKLKPGDIVTYHWNSICDLPTKEQLDNLNFWNKYHLDLVNKCNF